MGYNSTHFLEIGIYFLDFFLTVLTFLNMELIIEVIISIKEIIEKLWLFKIC